MFTLVYALHALLADARIAVLSLLLIAGGSYAFQRAMSLRPFRPALPSPQNGLGPMAATNAVFDQVSSC